MQRTTRHSRLRVLWSTTAAVCLGVAVLVGQQGFGNVGPMSVDRVNHTATLLDDGRVLIVGGSSQSGFLDSAELYSPSTRRFNVTGAMSVGRAEHSATLLADGRVLITGGGAGPQRSAEIYDPVIETFLPAGDMVTPRVQHATVLFEDGPLRGQVLIIGGDEGGAPTASAELFNPQTGSFATVGSLGTARTLPVAVALNDRIGRVLVLGGYTGYREALSTAEVFDPQTLSFAPTGGMSVPRVWASASLLKDDRVLVTGGVSDAVALTAVGVAEIYDPDTGDFTPTDAMVTPRWRHASLRLRDGRVFVAGGAGTSWPSSLGSSETYDPKTGTFVHGPSLLTTRNQHTMTRLANGKILVTGGHSPPLFLSSAELINSVPRAAQ